MMNTTSLFTASLLALALSTAACSGGNSTADLYGTPPAPTTTGSSAANDAGPTSDAAVAIDANVTPPIAKHCNGTVGTADLCLENAQGHAGEVVDVDVYFLGSNTCTDALEVNGRIVADGSHFALANPIQQVNCISRDFFGAPAPGTTEIMWNAFGGGAISACPNKLSPGKLDTVKIQILPGTPPGVYPITWNDAGIVAPSSAPSSCSLFASNGQTVGIGGQIRVLP